MKKWLLINLVILLLSFFIVNIYLWTEYLLFLAIYYVYSYKKPNVNKIRILIDSAFIFSILGVILGAFLFLSLPRMIQIIFHATNSEFVLNLLASIIVDIPTMIIDFLSSLIVMLLIVSISCLIDSCKKGRYLWFTCILLAGAISIPYYFLYYRKELSKLSKQKQSKGKFI